jgi:LacI family transcriptional regulator
MVKGAQVSAQAPSEPSRRRRRVRGADGPDYVVTLQDVAARAQVSPATASRVINAGSRRVGQPMVDRVLQAAADLGYSANLQARAVATGRTNTIGVLVHDIADPYFSTIAAGLLETADGAGLLVSLSTTLRDASRESEYVALMRAQRGRGVVIVGTRTEDEAANDALRREIEAYTRGGGRVVMVGQSTLGVDTVEPENEAGARALARALVGQGHRTFAVLAGPRDSITARDRLAGFVAGLAAEGMVLPRAAVIHGAFTRDGGYEAMSSVLAARGKRPDCVFAVNDVMAVGALARVRAAGLSAPQDVGLAGFDDIPTLRDVHPQLTTVRLPLESMGRMAASLLLDEPLDVARVLPIAGEVVLRESTSRHSRD